MKPLSEMLEKKAAGFLAIPGVAPALGAAAKWGLWNVGVPIATMLGYDYYFGNPDQTENVDALNQNQQRLFKNQKIISGNQQILAKFDGATRRRFDKKLAERDAAWEKKLYDQSIPGMLYNNKGTLSGGAAGAGLGYGLSHLTGMNKTLGTILGGAAGSYLGSKYGDDVYNYFKG